MGGCCCSPRGAELDMAPVYYHCPQESEEHGSLSTTHGTSSAVSAGLLVDTNVERSNPDTYQAPPAPLPYDVGSHQQVVGAVGRFESADISGALEKSDCKIKTDSLIDSSKLSEDEPLKLKNEIVASATDEEDVCPTCLEEYDVENPRIITKCEHHFHLSCILEWMERSDTCPICDQVGWNSNNSLVLELVAWLPMLASRTVPPTAWWRDAHAVFAHPFTLSRSWRSTMHPMASGSCRWE